jgi:hypothetical protein
MDDVAVGDVVLVEVSHAGHPAELRTELVTRVTKTLIVGKNGIRYRKKDGYRPNTSFGWSRLVESTDERVRIFNHQKLERRVEKLTQLLQREHLGRASTSRLQHLISALENVMP